MKLYDQILAYQPFNEQEMMDKQEILAYLDMPDIFTRKNTHAHMTASAWVLNKQHTKVLMAYHNIYHSWAWLGGHADGEEDLLQVAIRETQEESGVQTVKPISEEPFSIEVLTVDGHVKKGKYVSSHLHVNVTYLLEADEMEVTRIAQEENSDVGWLTFEETITKPCEPWFVEHIYQKLNDKIQLWIQEDKL